MVGRSDTPGNVILKYIHIQVWCSHMLTILLYHLVHRASHLRVHTQVCMVGPIHQRTSFSNTLQIWCSHMLTILLYMVLLASHLCFDTQVRVVLCPRCHSRLHIAYRYGVVTCQVYTYFFVCSFALPISICIPKSYTNNIHMVFYAQDVILKNTFIPIICLLLIQRYQHKCHTHAPSLPPLVPMKSRLDQREVHMVVPCVKHLPSSRPLVHPFL